MNKNDDALFQSKHSKDEIKNSLQTLCDADLRQVVGGKSVERRKTQAQIHAI